jgi:hypothetical protein
MWAYEKVLTKTEQATHRSGAPMMRIPMHGPGHWTNCQPGGCIWDDQYCVAKFGQCGMHKNEIEAKCGAWELCGGVVCTKDYGDFCLARKFMDSLVDLKTDSWGWRKAQVALVSHSTVRPHPFTGGETTMWRLTKDQFSNTLSNVGNVFMFDAKSREFVRWHPSGMCTDASCSFVDEYRSNSNKNWLMHDANTVQFLTYALAKRSWTFQAAQNGGATSLQACNQRALDAGAAYFSYRNEGGTWCIWGGEFLLFLFFFFLFFLPLLSASASSYF